MVYILQIRILTKTHERLIKYLMKKCLEMSSMGTKVLQTRSVELAMKNNLPLQVLSSLTKPERNSNR